MLIQICASQNDLFGLDGDGIVYQYDFNTNNWMKLGHGRRDRGESPPAENAAPPGRGWAAHHEETPVKAPNEFDKGRSVPTGARAPSMRTLAVAILLVAGLHGTLGIAHADVPTAKEAGLPGMEALAWNGIFVPAGTPRPIIDTLHRELVRAYNSPEVKSQVIATGSYVAADTPEEFAAFIRAENEKWGKVIREAKIKAE